MNSNIDITVFNAADESSLRLWDINSNIQKIKF